jgi:probable HAF family extracellular repeat protein
MIDLVPPASDGTFPTGVAYGVNDLGQAVGYHSTDHNQPFLPFIYDKSSGLHDIGSLGGGHGIARAVNNAAQVVGDSITSEGADHAFLWSASAGMQDITPAEGFSQAEGINNHGEVAGWMETPGHDFAFIWRPTTGLAALGTLGGKNSYGYGINNAGQVVGEAATSYGDGNQRSDAFLWSATSGMIDLGTFGGSSSIAYGINDSGWVVGNAYDSDEILQPFVYDGISMRNLNDLIDPSSGWRLSLAQNINNLGQIAVLGTRSDQPWGHGLLLTPIPEPAGALLAICILPLRRRRSLK